MKKLGELVRRLKRDGVAVTVPIKSDCFGPLTGLSKEDLESHAEQIKGKLEHYAHRKLSDFFQFDVFLDVPEDSVVRPDENGMCLYRRETQELMTGAYGVRVLVIRKKVQRRADVVRAIRKIADWIECNEDSLVPSCLLPHEDIPF